MTSRHARALPYKQSRAHFHAMSGHTLFCKFHRKTNQTVATTQYNSRAKLSHRISRCFSQKSLHPVKRCGHRQCPAVLFGVKRQCFAFDSPYIGEMLIAIALRRQGACSADYTVPSAVDHRANTAWGRLDMRWENHVRLCPVYRYSIVRSRFYIPALIERMSVGTPYCLIQKLRHEL